MVISLQALQQAGKKKQLKLGKKLGSARVAQIFTSAFSKVKFWKSSIQITINLVPSTQLLKTCFCLGFLVCLVLFVFPDRISLCSFGAWNSLCRPGWPRIYRDLPTSDSRMLGLKVCATVLLEDVFRLKLFAKYIWLHLYDGFLWTEKQCTG